MTVKLDPITNEPAESRLTYIHGQTFAVLPGTDLDTDARLRLYVPVEGVVAERIFGKLRARQEDLEALATRAAADGLTDILVL